MKIRNIELISESDGTSAFPSLDLISESDGSSDYNFSQYHTNALTLSYPTNRLNLFEQIANNNMMDSLYKDNLIFNAYDLSGNRTRNGILGSAIDVITGKDNYGLNSNSLVNIMMPRSTTDIDEHTHEFVTSEQSLMSRGNDSIGNAIGSGISTMVADIFDNMTKGHFADSGEAIGTPTRATYKGAGHRTKTYTWKLSPRNLADLVSLMQIVRAFALYSYGTSSNSKIVGSLANDIITGIRNHYGKNHDINGVNLTSEDIINSFRYVKVMTNPTLWYIRNYNHKSLGALNDSSIFGPANIINMKINKVPDGTFQGFSSAPNMASSYLIEITFREAISHTRDTITNVIGGM